MVVMLGHRIALFVLKQSFSEGFGVKMYFVSWEYYMKCLNYSYSSLLIFLPRFLLRKVETVPSGPLYAASKLPSLYCEIPAMLQAFLSVSHWK